MKSFDIRYLDIMWNAEQSVLKVEESGQPIELEWVDTHWQGDAITYPKKYFYIGICITDKLIHTPYLQLPNNEIAELMPVKVPGENKTWWIQKGEWDKKIKKYLSSLYRTAGRVEVSVQNETVILENHTVNFSVADLEYFLSDLKDKLWMLMFDNQSASKISIQKQSPSVFSADVVKLFSDLAASFEAIVKKPHVTLCEIQEKKPKRAVKPVTKTFREIVTHSTHKRLTSRSYTESYNTPENRYLHYLAIRTLYLLKVLNRLASHQLNSLSDRVERDKRWLDEESNKKTKIVDPVVFDNEIRAIASDLEKLRQKLNEAAQAATLNDYTENITYGTYRVIFEKCYGKSETKYFVKELDGSNVKDKLGTYLVFSSSLNFTELLNNKYLGNYEFRFSGWLNKSRKWNNSGNMFYQIHFTNIDTIEIIDSPFDKELTRLKAVREKLAKNNWVSQLSYDEREGIENQVQIANNRLEMIQGSLTQLDEFSAHIPSLLSRVKKTIHFLQTHKVNQQQDTPNSMVFVQNPLYASAKSLYQKVSSLEGLDDSLLNSMMAIDEIGLVNLPDLYERWCLVQLIYVIRDNYRFQIKEGWQEKLINAVLRNGKNIELYFSSEVRQLSLTLTYEKELDTGKRPDFVLDLHYKTYEHHTPFTTLTNERSDPVKWYVSGEKSARLVLDAKFRGEVGEVHINNLVEELCDGKNYSENGKNAVFIIHPVAEVIRDRTSPLKWGAYCNYGQAEELDHKKGAVYLSPSREHSHSVENLQRLLGMFLQKHTCVLDDGKREDVTWHNKSCICCGGNDLYIELTETQGGNDVNKIHCHTCKQNTTETLCVSCRRRLYKNGINWTYHRTRAEQTSNIVCPRCETFL